MPEDARPDQPQPERTDPSSKGSERPGDPRERPDWRHDGRGSDPYWGPPPPYWDPYWGAPPHYGWGHHWRHGWPPAPDFAFFEAMMRFAAGAAGFREHLWREMADAARHAQRDWSDPYAYPYGSDPYPPPPDPRHPDDRESPHERRDDAEASDAVDLKELRATLEAGKEDKLKKMRAALEEAEASGLARTSPEHVERLRKSLAHERAKAEAAIDTVIHDVKLARVTEAMRRKTWSRGAPPGRWR